MTRAIPLLATAIALALAGQAQADAGPRERALELIRANPTALRATRADRFVSRDVIVDADGTEHVRFERSYGGLPVIGGDFVVHSRNGQFKSASTTMHDSLKLATR